MGMFAIFDVLNNSKYFSGLIMILLNFGSKYIAMEVSPSQESFMANIIIRRLLVFTVFFTATRDIWVSIILTAAFIILVSGLFNDNSKYCIIPKKMREYSHLSRKISKKKYEQDGEKENDVYEKILNEKRKSIEKFKNNI